MITTNKKWISNITENKQRVGFLVLIEFQAVKRSRKSYRNFFFFYQGAFFFKDFSGKQAKRRVALDAVGIVVAVVIVEVVAANCTLIINEKIKDKKSKKKGKKYDLKNNKTGFRPVS